MRGQPQKNPPAKPTAAPKKAEPKKSESNQKPVKTADKKAKNKTKKSTTASSKKKTTATKEKKNSGEDVTNNKTTTSEKEAPVITIPEFNVNVVEWSKIISPSDDIRTTSKENLAGLSEAAFVLFVSHPIVFNQLGEEFGKASAAEIMSSESRNILNKNFPELYRKSEINEENHLQNINDGLRLATSIDPKKSTFEFITEVNDIFNLGYVISESEDPETVIQKKIQTFSLGESQSSLNDTKILFHCTNGKSSKYQECISSEYKITDDSDVTIKMNYRVEWAIFKDSSIARTNNGKFLLFKQGKIKEDENVEFVNAEIIAYEPVF